MIERIRPIVEGAPVPAPQHEYLFWQTVIGAWPFGWDGVRDREAFIERIERFLHKATKEAKQQTSWINPNQAYDEAVGIFVRRVLGDEPLVADLRRFTESIAPRAALNGLSQTLLRFCSPGIADTYQGCELWNQSLVDPDNRRPVDWKLRRGLLGTIRERTFDAALCADLVKSYADGRIKMFVTHVALQARKSRSDLFLRGDYEGVPAGEHVIAFLRRFESSRLLCCVPRFGFQRSNGTSSWPIGEAWGNDTFHVPSSGTYKNLFTGAPLTITTRVRASDVFANFPVALLVRDE